MKPLELIKLIKLGFTNNKRLIWGAIIHAGLMWASLSLSYSSYKEYMRGMYNTLPSELRIAIKATFPLAVLIFVALFVLYGIGRDKKDNYPSFRQYVVIFCFHVLCINFIFLSKGMSILIVQNLAILYFVIFLFIWGGMMRFAGEMLPPIIKEYSFDKSKLSHKFIIGFMILLMLCAFLLIFKQEKAAENLANIAYFLLVIGVGIEVYRLIRYGEEDEKR